MDFLCKINITQKDRLSKYSLITNLKELFEVVIRNRELNTLTFSNDFIKTYFNGVLFQKFVDEVHRVNPTLKIYNNVKPLAIKMDELFNDMNKDALDLQLHFNTDDFIATIEELITVYKQTQRDNSNSASLISSLSSSLHTLGEDLNNMKEEKDHAMFLVEDINSKLNLLIDRINYSHGYFIDKNKMFMEEQHEFNTVLYFKEISKVQYTDTFIKALKQNLMSKYEIPVRVVVIEPFYATSKVKMYPELKLYSNLTEEDAIKSDILMLGYQPRIFRTILNNTNKFGTLIILDRALYEYPHLVADDVQYFYLASDGDDISEEVPMSRRITYSGNTLNIPLIKNYDSLSAIDKFHQYSSIPIMKSITNLVLGEC